MDRFAVVQKQEQTLTLEQLNRAFASLRELTAQDAAQAATHPTGVLASHLSREGANTLAAALAREGIQASAVQEERLILPPAHHVRVLEIGDHVLRFQDASERVIALAPNAIRVVGLAAVMHPTVVAKLVPAFGEPARWSRRIAPTVKRVHPVVPMLHEFFEIVSVDPGAPRLRFTSMDEQLEAIPHLAGFVDFLRALAGVRMNHALGHYLRGKTDRVYQASLNLYELEMAWLRWLDSTEIL